MLARGVFVLALALAPAAAVGQAQVKGPAALRGPEQPAKVSAPPPTPARPSLPTDVASGLLTSPAPPLSSPASANSGGSECRRSCAQDLYMCRADRDEVDCNPVWMRCVLSCPEASSSLP
jgi:hypothetical protein